MSTTTNSQLPNPLLRAIIHRLDVIPKLTGICAGFETGNWRFDQLAEHMIEWLPEFALNKTEYAEIDGPSARKALRNAARTVYLSDKYQKRGEVGELLLHAIIRQEFKSTPLISKIYFKDSPNDTVKGFDAVHIVEGDDGLQLWLGEVKFYSEIKRAIRDVLKELETHLSNDFLRTEFAAICNKMDNDAQSQKIKELLNNNTSLDVIFKRLCIPVLLTYDSEILTKHNVSDEAYEIAITEEFYKHHQKFIDSGFPKCTDIVLILLPMNTKKLLIDLFDKKLKGLST